MKELSLVTVYPTKPSALLLVHPSYGPLVAEGSTWPKDLFTKRRIADGSVSIDKPAEKAPTKSKDASDSNNTAKNSSDAASISKLTADTPSTSAK